MTKSSLVAGLALAWLLVSPAQAQTFRRPVACDTCIANWFYFDQDAADGPREDWNCGTSTYNGHRGSDFSLAGGNGAISTGYDIVAGADGTVVSTQDGHYDRCGTCSASVDSRCGTDFGFGYGNHVVINHGSYRVVYAHMRQGSVRVGMGDTVRCGDVIGQIGSSGCTTGAHLHFETRPLGGSSRMAFDPFAGGCSATSPSLWTSQGPPPRTARRRLRWHTHLPVRHLLHLDLQRRPLKSPALHRRRRRDGSLRLRLRLHADRDRRRLRFASRRGWGRQPRRRRLRRRRRRPIPRRHGGLRRWHRPGLRRL